MVFPSKPSSYWGISMTMETIHIITNHYEPSQSIMKPPYIHIFVETPYVWLLKPIKSAFLLLKSPHEVGFDRWNYTPTAAGGQGRWRAGWVGLDGAGAQRALGRWPAWSHKWNDGNGMGIGKLVGFLVVYWYIYIIHIVYINTYRHYYMYIHIVYINTYRHIIYIYILYSFLNTYIYIYMYIYICIYIYMYIYTYTYYIHF